MYGRAYPEESAYPSQIPYQTVVPLQYSIKPGQAYVLADAHLQTDYYYAKTFRCVGRRDGLHRSDRPGPVLRDLVRAPDRLRPRRRRRREPRLTSSRAGNSETRRRLGSPAGFEEECRQVGDARKASASESGRSGPGEGTKVPSAAGTEVPDGLAPQANTGRARRGTSTVERRPHACDRRHDVPVARGPLRAFAHLGVDPGLRRGTSCGRPMRGRRTFPPQSVASSYVASSVSASASAPARVRPPLVVT